jgi:TldD protein
VLIEDGVLTEYMWDLLRSRRDGRPASGNGRRESYRHLPMPRMTNTFVLEGESDPGDVIGSVDYGLYCVQLGGGQVDPATGDFVFGVTEAYLIEGGEITRPVRAAQLVGNGPDVLRQIDAVGNDFETWTGMCGKQGQSVPVSSGQPTVLVREMTVGGTAA